MVDGLVATSASFSAHHPSASGAAAAAQLGCPQSCQQLHMAWAHCCAKSSSSLSLVHHSYKKLWCSSRGLKPERGFATISGFRVYTSRRPSSKERRGLGFASCSAAAGDRLGRLAWNYSGRNAAFFRSWIVVVPRAPPSSSLVLTTITRSLNRETRDGFEVAASSPPSPLPEGEVENSSRSSQAAPAKRQARTSSGGKTRTSKSSSSTSSGRGKVQQISIHVEGSPPAASGKAKARVSGGKEGSAGSESLIGRRSSSLGVTISSKQSVVKISVAASDTPEAGLLKPRVRSSKVSDSRASSNSGRKAAASTIAESVTTKEAIGSNVNVNPASSAAMSLQPNSNHRRQVANETKPKQPTERKPKKKDFPLEALLRRDLNMCSKDGDVIRALEIYEKSAAEGIVKWNQYNFNILLYLCSSAALGTLTARKSGTDRPDGERLNLKSTEQNSNGTGPVESSNAATLEQQNQGSNGEATNGGGAASTTTIVLSPEVVELAAQRGFEIFEDMKQQGVPPNEATLTAVARLAVNREDGDLAFEMVKEMAAMNIAPKLRSYSPALVTFCKIKAVEKAFEVDAHMVAAGVQPEEPELGSLLQLCVELRLEKEVYSLLHRLRTRVRALSPNTVASIEEWFKGKSGASAGKENKQPQGTVLQQAMEAGGGGWHGLGWLGKGEWKLEWTTVDKQGFCCSCKKRLVTIDLDPMETENFAQSVAKLAFARETKSNDFKRFQEWLDRHGPFDAIIDGANVGLYNQNFNQGGFNFFQLNAVAKTAVDQGLVSKPPLILLHHARTKFGAANSPLGQQLLQKWSSSNMLYTSPNGSNDDWYWLYAAVKNKCLLITNDEMRDHLFQLLGNDFFPRWKERHQRHVIVAEALVLQVLEEGLVRFSATTHGPQFHLPPPYSLVIQESENGSWHIPKSGGNDVDSPYEWLCITRPGLSSHKAASSNSGLTTSAENVEMPPPASQDQTDSSPKPDSPDLAGTAAVSSRLKRSRANSPSATFRKIRAADKKSDSGPVMFDT